MSKDLIIVKPQFSGEIKANIKSVGEIESNMKEVKSYVENLNNYYKNITFTEETIKEAKEEKANINKFKKQVADYRKNIVSEFKKPIKNFDDTSKETERLLTDTYSTINEQVIKYEQSQKEEKEQEIREYFEELKQANSINFITFEQTKTNVTLTASKKSLKDNVDNFINKIIDDLNLIETQEYKAEILVEYKQTLNVSNAITTVANRFKAIEEEKKRQEEKAQKEKKLEQVRTKEPTQEILEKPIAVEKEEVLTLKFQVRGTKAQLRVLKEFLIKGGYDYE